MNNYQEIMNNVWINKSGIAKSKNLECVVFDCDGTLVNINNSYNACIKRTVGFILQRIIGGKQWYDLVTDEMILKFRMSGGFNNDIDTTYASILSTIAANTEDVELARKFVLNIATHGDERGIISIEKNLSDLGFNDTVKYVKDELKYPGLTTSSLLNTVFDEFFYGKKLFIKKYGKEPIFNNLRGFIDQDKIVILSEKLDQIFSMFNGKITIVSGRSRLATEYTLKPILHYFNLDASVFIEDEEKNVKKNNINLRVNKPFPYALLKSMKALDVNNALCVGDSIEDMLMTRKASESANVKTVFCGVYGVVPYRDLQFKAFMDKGADIIIENINILPKLLESFYH